MRPDTATRLMESIAANRLTVFCGAGLSMAPPSSVPSALRVARECADSYLRHIGTALDPAIASDIEGMAKWFSDRGDFENLFIDKLVPWGAFRTPPNQGHDAVADFLACGIVHIGITTNYDQLVESAAQALGEPDFLPIVDAEDIPMHCLHRQYLKVHGCLALANTRRSTIWFREQLTTASIHTRMERFRTWLQTNLLGRDILIVGFWSDWAYLADVFAETINVITPNRVYLVDPSSAADLQAKAPALWDWSHRGIEFHHEQESGAIFLDDLRQHLSRVFLRNVVGDSATTYQGLFGEDQGVRATELDPLGSRELYALRRDLTGVPRNRPVRIREPEPRNRLRAAFHTRLLDKGATYDDHTYSFNGETIRLIDGSGELLSQVKERYDKEPPLPTPVTRVICIGALDDPTPASVVRGSPTPSILHSGIPGTWESHDNLLAVLRAP